jgi:4-aminobutyrate aminotransferase-like enzyme
LARHATARPNIVVFHGSFHGRTIGAASQFAVGPAQQPPRRPAPKGRLVGA